MAINNRTYQFKDQSHSSHTTILELFKDMPAHAKILEVGIGGGLIGRHLSAMGFEMIGVDKERPSSEGDLNGYRKILILDLNKESLPALEPLDYIILADILEHIAEPSVFLKGLKPLLKENGLIIISLPNVANWVMRLKLLFGRFDYQERGILDRGHLRFFTLKTCRDTIRSAGLRVKGFYSTSLPFQFLVRPRIAADCINEIYYFLVRIMPALFGYQFIFLAESAGRDG